MSSLFDEIHDSHLYESRKHPATIEEFVKFGLALEDYVRYVGLQHRLQGEMLIYGYPSEAINSQKQSTYPAFDELISFCAEKRLIDSRVFSRVQRREDLVSREDAEYYHGWLRYPKDAIHFRLAVERKLSRWWDEEDAYIAEVFGAISFEYDNFTVSADGRRWIDFDSPVRIKKYDAETNSFIILKNSEVRKLFKNIQEEKQSIEIAIDTHLAQMPAEQTSSAITEGLPWIKRMFELYDRQEVIENVYETIERAANTPDIYKFKETDVLYVFCEPNTCKENDHLLSKVRAEFSFYGKENKSYTIERCAHCLRFQIALEQLLEMMDEHGVPRCVMVYDDDEIDFSGFAESSKYRNMGYTVSQTVGLTAATRQKILKHIIDTGNASKYEVLTFLKQRMNINGMKPGNEIAFRKWKEDYEYIRQL